MERLARLRGERVSCRFDDHGAQSSQGSTGLYVVGRDGQIWSNFFPSDGRLEWSGWFALGPNAFPVRSKIAGENPEPGESSLFVTGIDGKVWSSFYDPRA